jgi:hypothetical protein
LVCVLLRLLRMSEKSRKEEVKIDRLHWIQMVSFSTSHRSIAGCDDVGSACDIFVSCM